MLGAIIIPFTSDEECRDEIYPQLSLIEGIEMREKKVDYLENKIGEYLFNVARQPGVSEKQACEIYSMISIVKDMESIGDIIQRNMLPMIERKKQLESDFLDEGKEEILIYHRKAKKQIRLLMEPLQKKIPNGPRLLWPVKENIWIWHTNTEHSILTGFFIRKNSLWIRIPFIWS